MNRIYSLYFQQIPIRRTPADEHLHLLNAKEIRAIRRLEWWIVGLSAVIGTNGVLLLYLPQYFFPAWFPISHFTIPWLDFPFDISIIGTIYGSGLAFVEVWLLYLLNLYGAHEIAVTTGFLDRQTKADTNRTNTLLQIGLEKKDKQILRYGIDPYQGLPKRSVLLISLFFSMKATLSNVLVKIFLRRILGRYAVREVMDLAGIPVFAFWNAIATRVVLREARVVIMGQNLIERLLERLDNQQDMSVEAKGLIYDTLQYIAICKRDYHRNHYYLTHRLLTHLNISAKAKHILSKNYVEQLSSAPVEVANLCRLIIVFGLVLDGELSWREKQRIAVLNKKHLLTEKFNQIQRYKNDFLNGRGLETVINKYL